MRWNPCKKHPYEQPKYAWHRWWAWHPVTARTGVWVVFEAVLRRRQVLAGCSYDAGDSHDFWEYKLPEDENDYPGLCQEMIADWRARQKAQQT